MFSSESIPALEAAIAGTDDPEVRRVAGELLERQKRVRDDVNQSIGRDEIRNTFDRTACSGPALLLLIIIAAVVASASFALGLGRPVD